MTIHEPGRRRMHFVPLKFVQKRVGGGGGRALSASLNLTSMIDFLVTVVVFLLMTFSASGENTIDMVDAPMIAVNGSQVLVDGVAAGSTRALEEAGRLQRIDELFNILKSKRELWKATQGGSNKSFPGVCIMQVDQNVAALVVKSVFQTAAFAGYPNVSFMVGQLPRNEHH